MSKQIPNIGLLVNELQSTYQVKFWNAIKNLIGSRKFNLISFPGRGVRSPIRLEHQYNVIFDYINDTCVDAIVVVSSTLANYVADEEFFKFCRKFSNIPMVSIGLQFDEIPSVIVDNKTGMLETIDHLIKVHNYKQIAFVTGLRGHPEAELRYETYLETLRKNNHPIDHKLIVNGDFTPESGKRAVENLLLRRKTRPDAIVFSNDDMAEGALTSFRDLGVSIPDDIAVTGFDNVMQSEFNRSIPITTVEQPFDEIAEKALDIVFSRLENRDEPVEMVYSFPTRLIVRQSCGCYSDLITKTAEKLVVSSGQQHRVDSISLNARDEGRKQSLIACFEQLDQILKEASEYWDRKGKFLKLLSRFFASDLKRRRNILIWNDILDELLIKNTEHGAVNADEVFIVIEEARDMLAEKMQIFEANKTSQLKYQNVLRREAIRFAAASDLESLSNTIRDVVSKLGFGSFCFYMYENEIIHHRRLLWKKPLRWKLISAENSAGLSVPFSDSNYCETDRLLPEGFLSDDRCHSIIVFPLFYNESQLGLFLLEVPINIDFGIFEPFHIQIGSAIKYIHNITQDKVKKGILVRKNRELQQSNMSLIEIRQRLQYATAEADTYYRKKTKFLSDMDCALENQLRAAKRAVNLLVTGDFRKTQEFNERLRKCTELLQSNVKKSSTFDFELRRQISKIDIFEKYSDNNKILSNHLLQGIVSVAPLSHDQRQKIVRQISNIALFYGHEENQLQDAYNTLDESITYLERLVELLSEISRIDDDCVELCPSDIDFSDFMARIRELLAEQLTFYEKQEVVAFNIQCDEFHQKVAFDRDVVYKILENLLSNAVNATGRGIVSLRVNNRDRFLEFSIDDSGHGISDSEKSRIFDDTVEARKFSEKRGVGLGLVLVKKLVELCDGELGFSSTYNQGSRFWFKIPI